MPAKKIVSDVYTIRAPQVIIDGNLIVGGTATETSIQNTSIQDKTIVLNDGEIGPGITGAEPYAGIEIDRGSANAVGLRFNEDPAGDGSVAPAWQATENGTTWKYILQGTSGSSGLSAVVEDTEPLLGGNLDVNGFSIGNVASTVSLTIGSPGAAKSGLYVTNNLVDNEELVTKRTAFLYALIF